MLKVGQVWHQLRRELTEAAQDVRIVSLDKGIVIYKFVKIDNLDELEANFALSQALDNTAPLDMQIHLSMTQSEFRRNFVQKRNTQPQLKGSNHA
jgi:hypothetical protein